MLFGLGVGLGVAWLDSEAIRVGQELCFQLYAFEFIRK